jgi:hypothetical protein
MRTLAAVAHGLSDNLITRAADVMLKERRRSGADGARVALEPVHLRNMVSRHRNGPSFARPCPALLPAPQTVADMVDNSVAGCLICWLCRTAGRALEWAGGQHPNEPLSLQIKPWLTETCATSSPNWNKMGELRRVSQQVSPIWR